jgi:hypothetical protein
MVHSYCGTTGCTSTKCTSGGLEQPSRGATTDVFWPPSSTSQDDETCQKYSYSNSDDYGEGDHEEPPVEEPSGTMVNARIPAEQNLSVSHHLVNPRVVGKHLSNPPCIRHS